MTNRTHRSSWIAFLAALAVAGGFLLSSGASPSKAQYCITTLPVSWSLPSTYAASYSNEMDIYVHSNGPRISRLSVSISTYGGSVLGKGSLKGALTSNGTIKVHLNYPMQPGKFSLYFYGYPNADPSCGPKHASDTINLTGCVGSLPVKLNATAGMASSYGDSFPFIASPTGGQLFKDLTATLKVIGGPVVGHASIPVLFGNLRVVIPLTGRTGIAPGPTKYRLSVSGYVNGRPASCGPLSSDKVLTFR